MGELCLVPAQAGSTNKGEGNLEHGQRVPHPIKSNSDGFVGIHAKLCPMFVWASEVCKGLVACALWGLANTKAHQIHRETPWSRKCLINAKAARPHN